MAVAILVILVITLVPGEHMGERFFRPSPFPTLFSSHRSVAAVLQVVGNVILFMPLGASLRIRGLRLKTSVLTGIMLSATVEAAQYVLALGRIAALSDVVLNTAGALLGYVLLAQLTPENPTQ